MDAPVQPVIVPPAIESEPKVLYPEGAEGDATVILELSIAADGSVLSAIAKQDAPPFSDLAVESARTWQFEPATRNGEPIAARILFEVRFVEPPPAVELEPPAQAKPKPEPPEDDEPSPEPEEIHVSVAGARPDPAKREISRAEIRQLPGAFGDPFRAIDMLPGVTPIASGIPFFFVRGAPPGNLGYYLDGIRVPLLFHLGLGPGVVHPGMVESVDIYPGGYPARYGRYAGGIVAAETTAPRTDFHGEANVRVIDSGVLLEGGFAGDRGTALVAGRYSYTALLLSLIVPEVVLQYWDYQARVTYDLDAKNTLGVFSFGSFDYIGEDEGDGLQTLFNMQFHRLDLRWTHRASARTEAQTAVTGGIDVTDGGDGEFSVLDKMLAARTAITHRATAQTTMRTGADVTLDRYSLRQPTNQDEDVDFASLFPDRTDVAVGAWGDVVLDVDPRVTVTPGLRSDLYHSDGATAVGVDPRVAALYRVSEDVRLIHTLGVAHQPPAFVIPIPGLQLSALDDGLQQSVQSSAGVEVDMPGDFTSSVTLFQNAFFDMTDALGTGGFEGNQTEETVAGDGTVTTTSQGQSDTERLLNRSLGSAYGVELMIKRSLSRRFGGFIAYTLSRTTRSVAHEHFPSSFDRTHVVNIAAAYDLGRRWRAGSRILFYTGRPSSERAESGRRMSSPNRLPPFFRLDLRLEKRWRLGDHGYWAFVFEVLNSTLSKEIIDDSCDVDVCFREEIGPVTIPSIGVEVFF